MLKGIGYGSGPGLGRSSSYSVCGNTKKKKATQDILRSGCARANKNWTSFNCRKGGIKLGFSTEDGDRFPCENQTHMNSTRLLGETFGMDASLLKIVVRRGFTRTSFGEGQVSKQRKPGGGGSRIPNWRMDAWDGRRRRQVLSGEKFFQSV